MNKDQFVEKFKRHIKKKFKTGTAAAEYFGVSKAFISSIGSGNKQPNKAILDDMGLEKSIEVTYVKKRKE